MPDPDAAADRIPEALLRDPPADPEYPAQTLAKAIRSGGHNLNAILYTAAGAGPHPTVLLLHGLPGNEQNIDLAQSMRRAGWNVLTIHYRGSWGTPGAFSFAQCLSDADAAIEWLLCPGEGGAGEGRAGEAGAGGAGALRIDPHRLVVMGHSMGGYIAADMAARRASIMATALISPASIGAAFGLLPFGQAVHVVDDTVGTSEGLHILSGTTPAALAREVKDNAERWQLENHAAAQGSRPVLLITSDDGFSESSEAFAAAVAGAAHLTRFHFRTDHSYSDHRIALQVEVLRWLDTIGRR